jgi:hypothetical protein
VAGMDLKAVLVTVGVSGSFFGWETSLVVQCLGQELWEGPLIARRDCEVCVAFLCVPMVVHDRMEVRH